MPVMTGSIDVADGQDIRTLLPLTGMEKLELHVFTPGQDEIKFIEGQTDTLNIYKIEKIRLTGGTGVNKCIEYSLLVEKHIETVQQEYQRHLRILLKMQYMKLYKVRNT